MMVKLRFHVVCECDKKWKSMSTHCGASIYPDVNVASGSIHAPIGLNANVNAIKQTGTMITSQIWHKTCCIRILHTANIQSSLYFVFFTLFNYYLNFRCQIPVVIMGETGCGKTALVKFMCQLQCPPDKEVKSMLLMKVNRQFCTLHLH